jgi:hypothetical protein
MSILIREKVNQEVLISKNGAVFLSTPQTEIILRN